MSIHAEGRCEELARAVEKTDHRFSGVVALRPSAEAELTVVSRGFAHRPTSTLNRDTTRFGIASGTKGFTAAAVLRLVADGALSLDARLAGILPGRFPGFAPEITVRHLLSHTSGIPDYCDEELGCDFAALWADRPVYAMRNIEDFVPMFAGESMKFRPGARFSYSNSGFLILGLVIERLTGERYVDHINRTVFKRLGMAASGFFESDALPPDTATGYIEEAGAVRSNIFAIPIIGSADGGAFSTVRDLCRFWDGLFRGGFLPDEMLVELRNTCRPDTGEPGLGYSLGFWRSDLGTSEPGESERLFVLLGSDPGVSFFSGYDPETGGCYIIFSNSGSGAFRIITTVRKSYHDSAASDPG